MSEALVWRASQAFVSRNHIATCMTTLVQICRDVSGQSQQRTEKRRPVLAMREDKEETDNPHCIDRRPVGPRPDRLGLKCYLAWGGPGWWGGGGGERGSYFYLCYK